MASFKSSIGSQAATGAPGRAARGVRGQRAVCGLLFWIAALTGCAGFWGAAAPEPGPDPLRDDRLAIVTVKADETLASLAQEYLGDERKAHWIAEYNDLQSIRAGMRLAIPLKPLVPGGLRADGYQSVPVLLYPKIAPDAPAPGEWAARSFEDHLKYLRRNGFVAIGLDRLTAFFGLSDQLPPQAVLLTFDSAERWVYEVAFPLLKRYGFTAALFIPTDMVGRPDHVSWAELGEMAAGGFDIGAAGGPGQGPVPPGGESCLKDAEEQISQARKAIAENLKRDCRAFAHPEGDTDDLTVALLKKHGYSAAFTRQNGANPFFVDPYKVRRCLLSPVQDEIKLREILTTFISAELR